MCVEWLKGPYIHMSKLFVKGMAKQGGFDKNTKNYPRQWLISVNDKGYIHTSQ